LAHEELDGEGHGAAINADGNDPPRHAKLQGPTNHTLLVVQAGHPPRSYSKAYPLYYRVGRCTKKLN